MKMVQKKPVRAVVRQSDHVALRFCKCQLQLTQLQHTTQRASLYTSSHLDHLCTAGILATLAATASHLISLTGMLMQGCKEFIYMVPAAKHAADYHPYDLKIVPHTTVASLSDYSTMSAAGVTHFFHGQVNKDVLELCARTLTRAPACYMSWLTDTSCQNAFDVYQAGLQNSAAQALYMYFARLSVPEACVSYSDQL